MSDPSKEKAFDRIIKENLEATLLPIIEHLLHINIKSVKSLPGTDKQQTTLEREPDFVRILETEEGERCILHLEFQTTNDPKMIHRMLLHQALMLGKYQLPIRQYVIYLGFKPLRMRNKLTPEEIYTGFELINIAEANYQEWLASDKPEAIILAILANLGTKEPAQIIRAIIYKLRRLVSSEIQLKKYLKQLEILSRLRKLEKVAFQEIQHMPITYNVKEDYVYQLGAQEGREENILMIVSNALNSHLFKKELMSYEDIAEISGLSIDEVQKIHNELTESGSKP